MNGHLMASCMRNICTKNYQYLIIGFQVTVKNVADVFLRHSVHRPWASQVCYYIFTPRALCF